jgi:LacI family transcriptional regulator
MDQPADARGSALRRLRLADLTRTGTSATISDVSRRAGVSIKTVSRVLNKEKYVAEPTRERVLQAVADLSFHPNLAARALGGKRSFQIGLIYDNPSPYFAQNIQAGVRARCLEDGYRMIAQPCDATSPDLVAEIEGLIDQVRLDGVILTPPFTERADVRNLLAKRGLRYAMTSPAETDALVPAAFIDQAEAAAVMTAQLIALGHRRIGFVMGDRKYASSERRFEGFCRALADANIELDTRLIQRGEYNFESGSRAAQALLALDPPPTAIFASSDDMAAGVLAAAHRLGIDVPGRLSVAGFDDTDLAAVVWPPLTTIHQPVRELGYAAADLLLRPDREPEQRQLPFELVMRGSTAAP